jgi:hypothetical protein
MKVQFRCCLCGQLNVTTVDPDAERPRPQGLLGRLLGWFRAPAPDSPGRYTVECEFCRQNNAISSQRSAHRPDDGR